jgi:alanine racemase
LLGYQFVLNIFIDINTGMNRTGILPNQAFFLYEALELLGSLNVKGLHVYDGHIRESDIFLRKQKVEAEYSQLKLLKETIERVSKKKLVIITRNIQMRMLI